ncbi:hypothetical protein RHGRI_015782 [Rhododendron griersonianum]|uniref:Peptidase M14 domain-containing protein n=1 Tax=Rhododendron griersonianum TaxID=479676 RepID=A0AAV6JQ13_9ERIC|nr:hypothetical protein RHGRI_015782 [Rhododendron griersonianum]
MGSRRVLSLSSTPSLLVILFCFGPFSHINAKVNLTGPSSTPINRDLYHTSHALMEQIKALVHRHPDKLYMETFRSKNKGYHAEMTVVTYCRNRKQIDDKSKYRILLSFGQHGRELITSELALRILSILSKEQSLPNVDPLSLHNLFERLVIKVVPMENMNGRELVEAGDLCERRNGRGVDLNRNWSVDWGKKEKDYDPYEENPGTAPFSEPETQIMRKLCLSFEPHIWINVHSGMEALFMPYDHKNTTPDGLPSYRMKLMLQRLNHLHCKGRCLVGSGGGSVGFVIDWQIYGDGTASAKDCFKMFNPIDQTTFNRVLNDWSAAFIAMFNMSTHQLDELRSNTTGSNLDKFVSIDDYRNGYLMDRRSSYGKKMEVLDLGMQEIRTYFRLFFLSSVLLLLMFCCRISKRIRPIISGMTF